MVLYLLVLFSLMLFLYLERRLIVLKLKIIKYQFKIKINKQKMYLFWYIIKKNKKILKEEDYRHYKHKIIILRNTLKESEKLVFLLEEVYRAGISKYKF